MCAIEVASSGLSKRDPLEPLRTKPRIFDGFDKLDGILVVRQLSALFSDKDQQAIAGEWIIDGVSKLSGKIDVFFPDIQRDDSRHRISVAIAASNALCEVSRCGK